MRTPLLALALLGCGKETAPPKPPDPVVQVTTAAVRHGDVVDTLTAYGTVVPAPGSAVTISRPFETKVAHVLVTAGQRVASGDPLIRFELSPDSRLKADVTQNEAQAAKRTLDNVKHRLELGLATNADVLVAQQAVDQTSAEVKSLGSRGATSGGTINTPKAGMIATVHVQDGALVAAGQPLIEVVGENAIEAQLGVELARASQIHAGDTVKVVPLRGRDTAVEGTVRSVTHAVDTTTRLMPVMVTLTGPSLLLGEYVEATFLAAKHEGLLVPRSAVLPESDQYILFTVDHDKAKRHVVRVGVEAGKEIEIIAPDVHDGDRVVTLGNYGCADGAQVHEVAR